ncbi:phosphatidylethanolamine binding [Branchiostoma belcheri]|nr:phosphatidylethanolamine binding [Branchiostoma belcheri]
MSLIYAHIPKKVDLHSVTNVAGVRTQGRGDYPQWVTRYKLSFSTDGVVWDIYSEQGQEKEFTGNTNQNTIATQLLAPPVLTRFVRFHPLSWSDGPSMRMDVLLCAPVCQDRLGMESGAIPDSSITASSFYNSHHEPFRARLNGVAGGGWAAGSNDIGQWLQVHSLMN